MKIYKSDEARLKLRDILDDTIAGQESVIERYNKPVAVVVPYAVWQSIKGESFNDSARVPTNERSGMDSAESMG